MIRAVIFDFDDTIINYSEIGIPAHISAAKKFNISITKEDLRKVWGLPWKIMVEKLLPGIDFSEFQKEYFTLVKSVQRKPIPNVIPALQTLHKEGLSLAILTSKSRESFKKQMQEIGLNDIFSIIVTGDDAGGHKPDPKAFEKIKAHLGISHQEIAYVGDSVIDYKTAAGAGIHFIGVLTGLTSEKEFLKAGAKHIIKSSGVLPEYLNNMIIKESGTILPTTYGNFKLTAYSAGKKVHLALIKGRPKDPAIVRIHSQCLTGEVFHSLRCDCGEQLDRALQIISKESGILLYLDQEGRDIGLLNKIRAYALQDKGYDTIEANHKLGLSADQRDYAIAARILEINGINKVRLLTNNPDKIQGINFNGLKVIERIPLEVQSNHYNRKYLLTKKERMRHRIDKKYLGSEK